MSDYVDIRFKVSFQAKFGLLALEKPEGFRIETNVSDSGTAKQYLRILKSDEAVIKKNNLENMNINDTVRAGQIWKNSVGKKCIILSVKNSGAYFFHVESQQKYFAEKYKFYNDYWSLIS